VCLLAEQPLGKRRVQNRREALTYAARIRHRASVAQTRSDVQVNDEPFRAYVRREWL
jgi:hypothetical protein